MMENQNIDKTLVATVLVVYMLALLHLSEAQNQTQVTATADPREASVVNSIFQKWGIRAGNEWNISGELCNGVAIDSTFIDDTNYNPLIKCDCSFKNRTSCRILMLKVYQLDVRGPIPEELWSLDFLNNLNLGRNFLSGSLSPSVGNLTHMQWLNFGMNSLSGEMPKELGLLTDLRSLGIGDNNFSGTLPPELGNCLKLQKLYIGSSGVRGEIPGTYANLQNMVTLWAYDVELSGRIPDFIGNWSKLTSLRFIGNNFQGPIPSTFSNLTSLTELTISDLLDGTSSLAFLKNLKALTVLVLRNNNISDSIPPNIGEYQSLKQLDLSFNNLTGSIPNALFNLRGLTHLFLGNNKLTGNLPAEKSSSLLNIDVTYNNLVGNLPAWVNERNLTINLIANNLTVAASSNSILPSGLDCLQRNFPCNRGKPRYYDFGIKCGGPEIKSASGFVYERENETLGPASYFVNDARRWAVSTVGLFTGSNRPQYKIASQSEITNTLDTELFRSSRISPSSLRYYGLGLENGNYNLTFQFAETVIESSSPTWTSLGRRVFDIYVQGNLVLKDFDIHRAAGGVSNRAVSRQFKASVSENYLDVHFFWAGKGSCCIPFDGNYGPLISAISATPDFIPSVNNMPPTTKKSKTGMIVGIVVGLGVVAIVCATVLFCIVQKRRRQRANEDEEFLGIEARPYTFTYSELKGATEDLSPANKLGQGGFGPVYKGKLNDGREIAVKQLSVASRQGKGQFIAEIATISAVQHRNLVKLYGCCIEGDQRLLVYEYLPNKSLDQALFGEKNLNLNWPTRYEICLGIARGLAYLHEESRLRIVHRDVKASNILLDGNLVPKISDFGLAKLYDDKMTHISTRVAGTIGYLAPEYAMRGHLTEKADVFAFGVVALELISSRPNSDQTLEDEKKYLLTWVWMLHENNREVELVDSNLKDFNEEEVKRMISIALLCTQTSPTTRPTMSRVVAMLSGDVEVSTVTSRPGYLTDWKFEDVSTFMSTDTSITTNSTSHHNSWVSGSSGSNTKIVIEDPAKPILVDEA